VKSAKIVALILGSSLFVEACNPVTTRIPTVTKRPAQAVSQQVSDPKVSCHRAKRNKGSTLQDPEYQRVLERARRWKEQQKKPRIPPGAPPTVSSSEVARATPVE
jgi:hypothetical protein